MLVLNVLMPSVTHLPWNFKSCISISKALKVLLQEQEERTEISIAWVFYFLTTVSSS